MIERLKMKRERVRLEEKQPIVNKRLRENSFLTDRQLDRQAKREREREKKNRGRGIPKRNPIKVSLSNKKKM